MPSQRTLPELRYSSRTPSANNPNWTPPAKRVGCRPVENICTLMNTAGLLSIHCAQGFTKLFKVPILHMGKIQAGAGGSSLPEASSSKALCS